MVSENPKQTHEKEAPKDKRRQRPEGSSGPLRKIFSKDVGGIYERLHKKPEGKNELSPDETAMVLRDRMLDMMTFGVLASDKEVPTEETPKAVLLPHLLQYSPTISRHYDTFRGILHQPTEFSITADPNSLFESCETGDVLYSSDGPNHIYYFGNELTSPFANSWALAQGEEPVLFVSILQDNRSMNGAWSVDYTFGEASTLGRENTSSPFYPERDLVLDFLFSPAQLEGEDILKMNRGAPRNKKWTTYQGEVKQDGFRRLVFHCDGAAVADDLEKDRLKSINHEQEVAIFREKGDIDFSVVEIGTVTLGGQKHWVYTGSEHAQLPKKQERRVGLGALKTIFEN